MSSIAFVCATTGHWGDIDPQHPFAQPLGGRETAAVRLAQEFARQGWSVGLGTQCASTAVVDGVLWLPSADRARLERSLQNFDVVVSVDDPTIFDRVRVKLNILHSQFADTPGWASRYAQKIDHYMFLSLFQQNSQRDLHPEMNPDTIVLLGNGVDLARYDDQTVETVPGRMVWSSSPDRGLHHLLRWWPTLKAWHPHITLKVFYNLAALEPYRWQQEIRGEWARTIDQGRSLPGVEYVGPVDQITLAREQLQAELFVYPCDPPAPTETYCITALENAAARVPLVLSDADCLPDIYGDVGWFVPAPPRDDLWMGGISHLLTDGAKRQTHVAAARAFAEAHTWERVGQRWADFLSVRLTLSDPEAITELVENVTHGIELPRAA